MRTTLKRGVGRGAGLNGKNGRAVLPPATRTRVARYRQEPPRRRGGIGLLGRILAGTLLTVLALALGIGGGALLYLQESFEAVKAHTPDVLQSEKELDIARPGQPAIALVIGYDQRAGQSQDGSRSDTIMLIRADPQNNTVSLLSIPRDLGVPIYCPHEPVMPVAKINSAYAVCGSKGTVDTVKHLTGLQIQYLITVGFHGFQQIVDKIGGIWLDVDRSYYHVNNGTPEENYSNINLQPGYQLLNGYQALSFVRYRHTDDDYHRIARQQEFIRALKQQLTQVSLTKFPALIHIITENVELGSSSKAGPPGFKTLLDWMVFAVGLPGGHVFQDQINGITGASVTSTAHSNITQAVYEFTHPTIAQPKDANDALLGVKVKKPKASPPDKTSVLVLNGNGVAGAAAEGAGLLHERGYVTVLPPGNVGANAPTQDYFHTQIYYDKHLAASKPAATRLARLIQFSDVAPLPRDPQLLALDPHPHAMVVVVLGTTFRNRLVAPPPVNTSAPPPGDTADVVYDASTGRDLLEPFAHRVPFRLEVPTIIDADSEPDDLDGDKDARLYWIDKKEHKKAVYLVFRSNAGVGDYWGIEETNMPNPPILSDKSYEHLIKGREYWLYYSGSALQMVVLRGPHDESYWVMNTLLNTLSNKTMLAIAKGLRPLTPSK